MNSIGKSSTISAILALATVLSFLGCSSQRSSLETLEESLLYFHTHLKAGEIERASSYVAIDAMDRFLALHDPERNILVMEDFSIKQVSGDPSSSRMEVRVTANVRKRNSLTIKTIKYHETWEKREGNWMMIDEEVLGKGFSPLSKPLNNDMTH